MTAHPDPEQEISAIVRELRWMTGQPLTEAVQNTHEPVKVRKARAKAIMRSLHGHIAAAQTARRVRQDLEVGES
jgi:hypothetical protein